MHRRDFLFGSAAAGLLGVWTRRAAAWSNLPVPDPGYVPARPAHHDPEGGFRNPWPTAETREPGGVLRWQRERRQKQLPPDPAPGAFAPVRHQIARPRAARDELRITWVGHASFLVQIGGVNLLTDPHWSERASPVQFAGPARFGPPGVRWDDLPPIDGVLQSHDHYDHLDHGTVRRLRKRFGDAITWFAPLKYRDWYRGRGVRRVSELDWYGAARWDTPAGPLEVTCLPAQHWTSRTLWDRQDKLWSSWAVRVPGGRSLYFGGDSGYFPDYAEIARRAGPFDALLLPVGAYEPRWFMRPMHMNPEDAVQAYHDLGGRGLFAGMHWGTWRLTDEDPLEPPKRIRSAWAAAGLPAERLWVPKHGETRVV